MNLDNPDKQTNKTHYKVDATFEDAVNKLKNKIMCRGDLHHVSCNDQLKFLDQLCEFPFGRYILERKGANGFWTDYLISHPNKGKPLSYLEDFILNRSLIVVSHRDRFRIYQRLMQKLLKENIILASIPCGLMRDLLSLDFSQISNYKLFGIDIDDESISHAEVLAADKGINNVSFHLQDAWQMSFHKEFDVITSSGLNVYESDPNKVLDLYHRFFHALKPGGSLITSVLTYPPGESKETDWDLQKIPPEDILMENILFKDILDLHWRNFRTVSEIDQEFKKVGFSKVSIHFDKYRIFPTVFAQKD